MESIMIVKPFIPRCALALGLALWAAVPGEGNAQQLPVASQGLPGYAAGAQEVPDPGLVYKVLFDVASAGPLDKVHPGLAAAARYVNVLAEYGVPPIRRQIVIVLQGAATQFALQSRAFAARNHGKPNPDAAVIDAMKKAGVSVRADGQAVLAEHIALKTLLPGVQVDLSAVSTLVNLQLHGYVRIEE